MKVASGYDKFPYVRVSDRSADCLTGWPAVTEEIARKVKQINKPLVTVVIECYQGVHEAEIVAAFAERFPGATMISSSESMLPEDAINAFFHPDITDDELFGYMTRHSIDRFFDRQQAAGLREHIRTLQGVAIVFGVGAAYLRPDADILIYADMARWEIQQRFRRNEVGNIGVKNAAERASLLYKRAFFVDWRICDRFKKSLMKRWDYVLDTNLPGQPRMITRTLFEEGLTAAVRRPFRVVPFFDPGPWGGQWLKE
ncbi:MAG: mannose-6-phosphate isomerase, partial [Tannerella sp.]|nr:mannose-6-phosphate isomerase [Tannerella sp.]